MSQLIIPGLVADSTENSDDLEDKKLYQSNLSTDFINKLCDQAERIELEDAKEAGALGYMARSLVQTAMPHSDPKTNEFIRVNGHYKLTMLAPSEVGLPFGSIPRIIIAWITTEAIKTRSRQIYLGETMSRFIKKLGFNNSGGSRGDITRTKDHMNRLVQTHITCKYETDTVQKIKNIQAISEMESWWLPNSSGLWETELILNQDFYDEIIQSPIPIDIRAIKALKNSSLAIDIYCWLTYRMFTLRKPNILISWDGLFLQFGSSYTSDSKGKYAFKKNFITQLKKVGTVYSSLNAHFEEKGLRLYKSSPHIAPQPKSITKKNVQTEKNEKSRLDKERQKEILRKKYERYKLNQLIDIVRNLPEEEQRQLSNQLNDYLSRRNLCKYTFSIYKEEIDIRIKKALFDFCNSRWHHLLDQITPFNEYLKNGDT